MNQLIAMLLRNSVSTKNILNLNKSSKFLNYNRAKIIKFDFSQEIFISDTVWLRKSCLHHQYDEKSKAKIKLKINLTFEEHS